MHPLETGDWLATLPHPLGPADITPELAAIATTWASHPTHDTPRVHDNIRTAAQAGTLTAAQAAAALNVWRTRVLLTLPTTRPGNGPNLAHVPPARYRTASGAVVVLEAGTGRWDGWVFVVGDRGERLGSQRIGGTYRGEKVAEVAEVAADPGAAARRFAAWSGLCPCCGYRLGGPDAERGVHPSCQQI